VIEPLAPEVVYVPVYDPIVVYGSDYWPPAYVPFCWRPRRWVVGPTFGFGPAFHVGPALWCQYIKCIRKLRWIGLEEEAKRLQIELRGIEPAISALAGPQDTD
jgi:hypothetical protein